MSKVTDYTIDKFHAKQHVFGTVAIIENSAMTPEDVYCRYKTRGQVETMINAFKNVLEADRTYMQNPQALEGWMFLNLVALKWYYTLLSLLKQHELNRKYSPEDFLKFLAEVKKVKINDRWHDAECIRKTKDILIKIGLKPITQKEKCWGLIMHAKR